MVEKALDIGELRKDLGMARTETETEPTVHYDSSESETYVGDAVFRSLRPDRVIVVGLCHS